MIMMCDLIETLCGQTLSLPVATQIENIIAPVFLGQSFYRGRYSTFKNWFNDCGWCMAADMRAYDSTVPEYIILCGLAIMRACYADEPGTDSLCLSLFSGFVHSYFITVGGHLYRKGRGIPSGHPWTSLMGSICNWVVLKSVVLLLYGPRAALDLRVACCGDDFVIGFPKKYPMLNPTAFNAALKFFYGMEVDVESARLWWGVDGGSVGHSLPFLAHYMCDGVPERHPEEVCDSMLNPHKRKHSWRHRLVIALAFLYDTPFSQRVRPWLDKWIKICFGHVYGEGNLVLWFPRWFMEHVVAARDLTVNSKSDIAEAHIVPENVRIFSLRREPINVPDGALNRFVSYKEVFLYIRGRRALLPSNAVLRIPE
jgi:hypothetical protein